MPAGPDDRLVNWNTLDETSSIVDVVNLGEAAGLSAGGNGKTGCLEQAGKPVALCAASLRRYSTGK